MSVSFSSGGDSVIIRNPEFNDAQDVDTSASIRKTTGGETINVSHWPVVNVLHMVFKTLSTTERDAFIAFYEDHRGHEIDFVDQYTQAWTGMIIDDEVVTSQRGDCNYDLSITFRGERP